MIRPEDLRIGNAVDLINRSSYVHLPVGGKFLVGAIGVHTVELYHTEKNISEQERSFTALIADLCGIPLTEEILVKAGFKRLNNGLDLQIKNNGEQREFYDTFHIWNDQGTKKFSYNGEHFTPKIKYVHELQNLFYFLTKQELQIEL